MNCPLCEVSEVAFFYQFKNKDYHRCKNCDLISLPPRFHVNTLDEEDIYGRHENSPHDPRYRKFLSRIFDPISKLLKPNSNGLDFGCGPGPTLSIMLEEVGHDVQIYDQFFAKHNDVFNQKYDFITSTEVWEHLRKPKFEIERLINLLESKGILGVMTKLAQDVEHFKSWHYKNDPTHICFYSEKTFQWIANKYNFDFEIIGEDVIILRSRS